MTRTDIMGQTAKLSRLPERFASSRHCTKGISSCPSSATLAGRRAARDSDYVREQDATVTAFYASNVQVYLSNAQTSTFCETLEGLPHTSGSWFIGNKGMQQFPAKLKNC